MDYVVYAERAEVADRHELRIWLCGGTRPALGDVGQVSGVAMRPPIGRAEATPPIDPPDDETRPTALIVGGAVVAAALVVAAVWRGRRAATGS